MKKDWRIILLSAMGPGLMACSGDLERFEYPQIAQDEIHLSTRLQSSDDIFTRASDEQNSGYFVSGQYIDFYVYKSDGVSTAWEKTTRITGESGAINNSTGTAIYWPANSSAVQIYGWYPSTSTTNVKSSGSATTSASCFAYTPSDLTSSGTFTIASDQSGTNATRINDLMVGVAPTAVDITRDNYASSSVPLYFTHLLSKIKVTVTVGEGVSSSVLSGATVTIPGIYTQVTLSSMNPVRKQVDLGSGNYTYYPADAYNVTTNTGTGAPTADLNIMTLSNATSATGVAIIPPQDLSTKMLTITLSNNGVAQYNFPHNIEARKVYTYTVTLNRTGISVTTTISDWGSSESITSGTIDRKI